MLGRDIAAGLIYGARVSLLIGVISTAVAVFIGILVGALSGYFGGRLDDFLMRMTEFFQTIPQLAMAMVLVAIFKPNLVSIVGAIAMVSWPPVARLVRSEFMTLRTREFVQAAVVIGQRPGRIILTQILPNAASPIIVTASLMTATSILTESALSLPGAGRPQPDELGLHDRRGPHDAARSAMMSMWPGLAIMLTVLAINLIGEGLNDALNPQLRKRGA